MAPDSTSDIRIVLVEPAHPGNIGAVARAMMNMDLNQLVLVKPRDFPHPEATARAAGADSVLANARVVATVAEAIADCGYVAATTSRSRDQHFRVLEVRQAAARLVVQAERSPAAVLFGAERTGLENEHLEASHVLLRIPASSRYASLNLAMAVQLVSYEIFRARAASGSAVVGSGIHWNSDSEKPSGRLLGDSGASASMYQRVITQRSLRFSKLAL